MSSIKFDPETKFKWPDYGVGKPMLPQDNKNLKYLFDKEYVNVLNSILAEYKLPLCAGKVTMLTYVTLGNTSYMNTPLFGVYKPDEIDTSIEKSSLSPAIKETILLLSSRFQTDLAVDNDIVALKKKFRECAASNYFVVRLNLQRVYDPGKEQLIGHQNILVIAKNRGIVYLIEPQYSKDTSNTTYQKLLKSSIARFVEELGMASPTIVEPVETCPQAFINDDNCMFWALIIFFLLMLNPQTTDHNKLVLEFNKKYPTSEALTNYIHGFKFALFQSAKAAGMLGGMKKKRKTYRHKKSKHSRTLRR